MAGLGVLARLTQAASAERIAEQNFRSSLFAQGRREILGSRNARIAEGQAIAGLIERGIERQDKKDAETRAEKLERDKIASREKIAGMRGTGSDSAGPFIPGAPINPSDLPRIGEGDPGGVSNALMGTGFPGQQDDISFSGSSANRPDGFIATSEADNEIIRQKKIEFGQAQIQAKSALESHELNKPKQPRSIKDVGGQRAFQEALDQWGTEKKALITGRTEIDKDKEFWDNQEDFEAEKLSQADPRDVAALTKAKNTQIEFTIALEFLRSKNRPGMKVAVRGKGLFTEEQLLNVINGAERQEQLLQAKINSVSPLSTKPPAVIGGPKGLERAANEGNLNAQKANAVLNGE